MKLLLLCLSIFAHQVFAQKVVSKSMEFLPGTVAQIDARQCYKLRLESWPGDEIIADARMEGEYRQQVLLQMAKVGNTLIVSAGLDPIFKMPDDKLGAHKVVSIELKVRLPENSEVSVLAKATQLSANGTYEHLRITQSEGFCGIYGVSRLVEVHTQSADILVASSGASIEATSRYGIVGPNEIPRGEPYFKLHSISGNITLVRTE